RAEFIPEVDLSRHGNPLLSASMAAGGSYRKITSSKIFLFPGKSSCSNTPLSLVRPLIEDPHERRRHHRTAPGRGGGTPSEQGRAAVPGAAGFFRRAGRPGQV